MALWISRSVRRRLGLEGLLSESGRRVRLRGLEEFRRLAAELERPRPDRPPPPAVSAGGLLALSEIEEEAWRRLGEGDVDWPTALADLYRRFGSDRVTAVLRQFEGAFGSGDEETRETEEREASLLRELATLWALERHPAAGRLAALLHEGRPAPEPLFDALVAGEGPRPLGSLAELLTPATESLGEALRELAARAASEPEGHGASRRGGAAAEESGRAERSDRLLLAADVLAEERRPAFAPPDGAGEGEGVVAEPVRAWEPPAGPARYGNDPSWAAGLVLVAKQLPVWLHQLGVERLDEIPESELETLAARGFTGLWLVGLWERSRASQWIKQLCGNPEATASAYSIDSYVVAESLGGEAALDRLRERAGRQGLRLAADMVPNHTGLDSPWVLDHPERFLSLPKPPFPSYTFSGPDLSPRPAQARIFLEDHYYDATDAAVVFERLDRASGERLYLYHGNDGTGLPWNDTAQLDYRRADVREAVVETILAVARRFPVIRFDAAMTLAWKHFRRLWFPAPGEGGAIPSRSGHEVSERELREAMPREFWAEVVERVEREAPETLLLAEAFWLMEAHFARDLGLHRVYNSAFLNCLRHRRAGELRRQIADILRLDRRLLERQVNYLSNPDEAPVREVFGDGPRWRAASILLATLPGTPLFAHGQVEGLRERYGMEYRRAYREEPADAEMVAWHESVLAPLLARRRRFAGSERFRLLKLRGVDGSVEEEVLAFANGGDEGLHVVVANLSEGTVRGVLRESEGDVPEAADAPGSLPLGAACRDLVGGGALPAAPGPAGGRSLALAPWETLVLTDFPAAGRPAGTSDASAVRPEAPAVRRPAPGGAQGPGPRPTAGAVPLALAVALGVTSLLGVERWLAGAGTASALLLAVSAAGWIAFGVWASRRP